MSDAINSVKRDILDFFRREKADVGNVLFPQAFIHQYMVNYNPKQKNALDPGKAWTTLDARPARSELSHRQGPGPQPTLCKDSGKRANG